MPVLRIKNWEAFQHYKDRNPPWIKLYTNTFQNYDFAQLKDASKLLAICIWTLAAREKTGETPYDFPWIKSQCSLGESVTVDNLKELIQKGFLILVQDASNVIAVSKQDAIPETETETETETDICLSLLPEPKKKPKEKTRGTRLPADWVLEEDWGKWAEGLGMTGREIVEQGHMFRDYWTAKAGSMAVKVNWEATWRNWCRTYVNRKSERKNYG